MISFALWTLVCVGIIAITYKLSKKPRIYRLGFLCGSLVILYFSAPVAFAIMALLTAAATVSRLSEKEKANARS